MPNSALRIVYLLPLSLRYFWLGANTTPYKYKDWNRVFRQRPTGRTSTKLDAGPQPAEVRNSGPPPPEAAARAAPRAAIFGRDTCHCRTPRRPAPARDLAAARAAHPTATVGRDTCHCRTPAKTCPGPRPCCGPRSSPNRNRRARHAPLPDTREGLLKPPDCDAAFRFVPPLCRPKPIYNRIKRKRSVRKTRIGTGRTRTECRRNTPDGRSAR